MTSKHGARHTPLIFDSPLRFRWTDCAIGRGEGQRTMWIARGQSIDYWAMLMDSVTAMQISFRRLSPETPIPEYKTTGACAFDIAVLEEKTLQPGERAIFTTGLVVGVPEGHVLLLCSRSSNAKKGISMANGVGVIDQDYCGPNDELKCVLLNSGQEAYTVQKGERVMQGLLLPIVRATLHEASELASQDRGGFGTTG